MSDEDTPVREFRWVTNFKKYLALCSQEELKQLLSEYDIKRNLIVQQIEFKFMFNDQNTKEE